MDITYTELLVEYNKFMEESGVRNFCITKCIPHCCNHPSCKRNTCRKSLGCVSFICYILKDRIFNESDAHKWQTMHRKALRKISWFNEKKGLEGNETLRDYNPVMDAFTFDRKDFEFLFELNNKHFKIRDDLREITWII